MTTPGGATIPVIARDESSICKHCRRPVEFFDYGYLHSDTMWADCSVVVVSDDRRIIDLGAEIRGSINPLWRGSGPTVGPASGAIA